MDTYKGIPYVMYLEAKRKLFGTKWFAEFDATNNCNLRCKHCYHFADKTVLQFDEVPLAVWEKRHKELYRNGIRTVLIVGGEPSLRPDLLMLADKIFPLVYIITNGTIKVPDDFNNRIYVSLDGSEKTNDDLRGDGVFKKVIKNYSGDKRVVINMTITKQNYNELEEVVRIAKENGFAGVVCNIYSHAVGEKSPLVISKSDRGKIIDEFKRVKDIYPDKLLFSKSMLDWYSKANHAGKCYWGDQVLHFYSSWKPRRCFGTNIDCSDCGCFAGALEIGPSILFNLKEISKIVFI